LFDRARMLARAGRIDEARTAFDLIVVQYGNVRDPWGFRLGDLARLAHAEMLLNAVRSDEGAEVLRSMVRSSPCCRGSARVMAVPSRPARPVRPMRRASGS
jgi:hypothetical protein